MKPVTLSDEHGDINIWMLPYLKPAVVRKHNNFLQDVPLVFQHGKLVDSLANVQVGNMKKLHAVTPFGFIRLIQRLLNVRLFCQVGKTRIVADTIV
jgi:hypothetical protein